MKQAIRYRLFFLLPAIVSIGFLPILPAFASIADDVIQKNQQIEQIQREIEQYQQQINEIHPKAVTLQGEVATFNAKINQITLELKSLALSISKTNLEIQDTQDKISDAEAKIAKDELILGQYLRVVYRNDQETLTGIIFKHDTLSDFFSDINSVKTTQDDLKVTIDNIKSVKEILEESRSNLEEKRADLVEEQGLEQIEKHSLDKSKAQKDALLKATKGQESKFQESIKQNKSKIQKIQAEIFYLQQNGVTVDDAIKYGNLAAIATGIRPAFLIAELEVESGLGRNVGRCNRAGDPPSKGYRQIMKPTRDIQPFLQITAQLGLNPETTAVSCPQANGWGGAMGPAQFIPSTWLGYAAEVARIVGRAVANPWNIEDAFTASAVKLARGGATAKTRAAEVAASKAYYSGNSKCSTAACNSYANAVQRVAAELEKSL
ncbi:MAG: lytic murein transglycosylase [Patescibacteria group bacterium]